MGKQERITWELENEMLATFLDEEAVLIVHTNFIGPDGFKRSYAVRGIPFKKTAEDFIKYMGYKIIGVK